MPQNPAQNSTSSKNTLQQLVALAKADGGKFFVIDETGQPVLVIMGIDDYEQVLLRKVENQAGDIEEVNRLIVDAARAEADQRERLRQAAQDQLKSEIIDSSFDFDAPVSY